MPFFTTPINSQNEKLLKEVLSLREQVEKLKSELESIDGALNDPRANLTLTTSEIILELKEQGEKIADLRLLLDLLTQDRDELVGAQLLNRNALRLKDEKLAALAEQNEKMRDALEYVDSENSSQSVIDRACQALSIPDLASPVLNKYRADGIRFGARVIELYDDATMQYDHMLDSTECATVLEALADELEKTND